MGKEQKMKNTFIKQKTPRQEFLESIANLADEFKKSKQEVEEHERAIFDAMEKLSNAVKKNMEYSAEKFVDKNPLKDFANRTNDLISQRLEEWNKKIEGYDRNTELRKEFGDSLLVFVYGKVKAGKSSLGNFIAYGHENPSLEKINSTSENPVFFMRAAAESEALEKKREELSARKKFSVASTEATTEIQGFSLPGLTWIDSPGLHSANPENGRLSRDYANSADLIIYPMNSASPGRESDFEEVGMLIKENKPLLAIISRCDSIEEDEDEDGNIIQNLVMKSPKDRQDQTNYVKNELIKKLGADEKNLIDSDVITISLHYAQANEGVLEALAESGTSALFNKLIELTKSQGVAIKKQTPLNNLRAFVDNIVDSRDDSSKKRSELSIKKPMDDLREFRKKIKEQLEQLDRKKLSVTQQIAQDIEPAIEKILIKNKAIKDHLALSIECNGAVRDIISKRMESIFEGIISDTKDAIDSTIKLDEIKDFPSYKDYIKTVDLPKNNKKNGLFSKIGAGVAALGAAAVTGGASLLVTIPAAITAGYVGSKVGSAMAGEETSTDSIKINLGDNTQEMLSQIKKESQDNVEKYIQDIFESIKKQLLDPLHLQSEKIEAALLDFENTLKNKVRPK